MESNKNELVFVIQELERKRIARDLHDTSLQNLTHLTHKLELASKYMDQDIIKAKLEIATIRKSLNEIIEEIRMVIYDLRPMVFDDLGLKHTIIRLLDQVNENTGLIVAYDIDDIDIGDETIALGIFRILEECIVNVCKHAKASNMNVMLKVCYPSIELRVEDDGIGFDMEEVKKKERHFGLYIIKERVEVLSGKINILFDTNSGTKIDIFIPKVLTNKE